MKLDRILATIYRSKQAQAAGDDEAARGLLARLIDKAPKTLEVWFALGEFHGARGEHGAAEAAFRRALALNPRVPETHLNLAIALRRQDRRDAAMAALMQAIGCRPAYPAAYHHIGELLLEDDRYAEAEDAFRVLLGMTGAAEAWVQAGIAAQGQQAHARARGYYEKALALGADSYTLHLNLGCACFALGEHADALAHARAAQARRPDCQVAAGNAEAAARQLAAAAPPRDA